MEQALRAPREALPSERDRALLHTLVARALRHFFTLQSDFSRFTRHKPSNIAQAALLIGTLQLRHLSIADHAAIHATVEAVKQRDPAAAKMVNAVLRRVSRTAPPLRHKPQQRAELPQWLYARWRNRFGADAVADIARSAVTPPPLTLAAMGARDPLLGRWRRAGITADAGAISPQAILVPADCDVTTLPGWQDGICTVMDQSAQLAALALCAVSARDSLCLDLCSAPGGKYALLRRKMDRVIAVELAARRIPRWRENVQRLRLTQAWIVQGDLRHPPFREAVADAVMLDAPCTASGLLRRHPDVKFRHDKTSVREAAETQRVLLERAIPLLKPGAPLLYAVCSIHSEENEDVVIPFLESGAIRPLPLPAFLQPFAVGDGMARLLPGPQYDGFFIAIMQRMP